MMPATGGPKTAPTVLAALTMPKIAPKRLSPIDSAVSRGNSINGAACRNPYVASSGTIIHTCCTPNSNNTPTPFSVKVKAVAMRAVTVGYNPHRHLAQRADTEDDAHQMRCARGSVMIID